ncbi:Kelch-like protein diablo [Aphelenchoides fujianensis]|nr:Kelch-like protein diablo [Aphelenchoides fujianensis]
MATACKHSACLSAVIDVQFCGVDVESPKCELPFRAGTKFSLEVTEPSTAGLFVKITIDGRAEGLSGAIWGLSKEGDCGPRTGIEVNAYYPVYPSLNDRVFCEVWTDECPFCEDEREAVAEALERERATRRKTIESLEKNLSELELQVENTTRAYHSRFRQLKQQATDNEQKLAAALKENAVLASTVCYRESDCGHLRQQLAEAAGRQKKLDEQQLHATALQNTLRSRIQQLEKTKATVAPEDDARVAKNTQLASTIQSLEEKLGQRKKAAKEAADREAALVEQRAAFEKELDALKSKLSTEKTRSSSLQRQVADHEKAVRESRKEATERERKLAAVQRENAAFVEQKKQLEAEIAALKLAAEKQAGVAGELAAASEKLESAEKAKAACTEQNEQLAAVLEAQQAASEAAAAEKLALEEEMKALLSRIAELEQPAEGSAPADVRLPAAFGAMRAAGFLTDFRLVVDGEKILVHRPVLAQKSAFFDSLFRSQPTVAEYAVEGIGREIVERLVDFVYGRRLLGLKKGAHELYAAARRFQIGSLLDECSRVLKAGISSENAVALLALAARHDDHELAAAVVEFVEANGGKFRLLAAIPPQAFKDDRETFKKILKWLNHEGTDSRSGGEQPLSSEGDSRASSEFERSEAQ